MNSKLSAKNTNAKLTKPAIIFAICAVALAAIFWNFTGTSRASLNFTDHPSASFGLASGQTARLNVVNPDSREPLTVRMQFLDENGNILKTVRTTVAPRQSFGLLLPYIEASRGENRTQIRAVVRMRNADNERLIGNVEVFDDATGRTSFGLLLPAKGFDPQPDPPAPR